MSNSTDTERVGFLGLGIMGSRMAANVARAGFPLTVWTHTPGKAERWASEHGARPASTPAAVAEQSDIVISMVVDGEQVASVLLGTGGVIESARPGLLCVDMSTIAPPDSRRIGAALRERDVSMLDAPVTGSSPRAEEGTLTIMAGGEAQDFERVLPLLETMGTLIRHVGELGQGEALKLINNSLGAANAAAVAICDQLAWSFALSSANRGVSSSKSTRLVATTVAAAIAATLTGAVNAGCARWVRAGALRSDRGRPPSQVLTWALVMRASAGASGPATR